MKNKRTSKTKTQGTKKMREREKFPKPPFAMARSATLTDKLIFSASAFMLMNYTLYLIKQFVWGEGPLPVIVCLLVLTILPTVIVLYMRGAFDRLPKKLFSALRGIYCFGLCFYAVTFLGLCIFIGFNSINEPQPSELPKDTVFVTLGAKVSSDKTPGIVLRRRLNRTAELMEQCPEAICIVSGGQGHDEPISEAQCMRDFLVGKGISPDRIVMEDKATDTVENLKYSTAWLRENGMEDRTLAFVTSKFHTPRVQFLCGRMNIENARFYGAPDSSPFMLYITLVREYMSYCKLFLWGR